MEKRDNEIFVQFPGRRILEMQGKLLRRANCEHQFRWEDVFHAIEQEKRWLHRKKARIHIQIRCLGLAVTDPCQTDFKFCD